MKELRNSTGLVGQLSEFAEQVDGHNLESE